MDMTFEQAMRPGRLMAFANNRGSGYMMRSEKRSGSYGGGNRKPPKRKRAGFIYIFFTLLISLILWPVGMVMLWRRKVRLQAGTKLLISLLTLCLSVFLIVFALMVPVDNPEYTAFQDRANDWLDKAAVDVAAAGDAAYKKGVETWQVMSDFNEASREYTLLQTADAVDQGVTWAGQARAWIENLFHHEPAEPAPTEAPADTESPDVTDAPADTEAPAEQTEAPAEVTEAPAEVTEAPAEVTEAPAEQTEAPAEVTEAPAEQTEAPAEQTEAPAEQTEAPAEQTEAPALELTLPEQTPEAEGGEQQVEGALIPNGDEAATEAPAEPAEAPVEPAEATTEPAEAPTEQTEAPVEPAEAPAEPAEAPVELAEAPVEPAEAPAEPAEAPAEPAEAPAEPAEAPVAMQVKPAAEATVYFYENGSKGFHRSPTRHDMSNAPAHTLAEAFEMGKNPCNACGMPDASILNEEHIAWVDENHLIHTTDTCASFAGDWTLMPLSKAVDAGYEACPECGATAYVATVYPAPTATPEPEVVKPATALKSVGDLTVYYYDASKGYHVAPNCIGMSNAPAHKLSEAVAAGKHACGNCFPPAADLIGLPMLWLDESGVCHTSDECAAFNGRYALISREDALAQGRTACPDCGATEYLVPGTVLSGE